MTDRPSILLVEDDPMIAMMVADMCEALGYPPPVQADSLETALAVIAEQDFGVALLDVHLGAAAVWPVADQLAARGTAFAFMTGGGGDIPPRHAARLSLAKPFRISELDSLLSRLMAPEAI